MKLQICHNSWSKEYNESLHTFLENWYDDTDFIRQQTSGSTGNPKIIELKKSAMRQSASLTSRFFGFEEGQTALICLSPDYIAGKMMLIRAINLGWHLDIVKATLHPLKNVTKSYDFSAMVPLQLENSLDKIDGIKKLIVGGGVVSNQLQQKLQKIDCHVFATYGMTETCGGCVYDGTPLEGVQVKIRNEQICIKGPVLASSIPLNDGWFETHDVGEFKNDHLVVIGRSDDVIISGGENVSLTAIEATLSIRYPEIEFAAFGVNDIQWGHALHLAVVGQIGESEIDQYLEAALGAASKPKGIHHLEQLPLLGIGKVDRSALAKMVGNE